MVKFDLLPSPLARLRRPCLGGREVGQNKSIFSLRYVLKFERNVRMMRIRMRSIYFLEKKDRNIFSTWL